MARETDRRFPKSNEPLRRTARRAMLHPRLWPAAAVFLATLLPLPSAAQPTCDSEYDPAITPPSAVLDGWPARPATTAEINAYVTGIAAETDRVVTRQFAMSWNGTPLYYSLVGDAATVADPDPVAAVQQELRDPSLTDAARAA